MPAFGSPHEDKSDVDREIRIEKMKRELEELSGGSFASGAFGEVSSELEETFLERVLDFEKAGLDTNLNRLVERGVEMVPPDELDDASLQAKLRDVVHALATIHCFLHDTDHLSDRELYMWLWSEGLVKKRPIYQNLAERGTQVRSAVALTKTTRFS